MVVKGLEQDEKSNTAQYPCPVANRFECHCDYEKGKRPDTKFGVDDLYDLASMAFAVEISLAIARKDTSAIKIKNEQDLYRATTNREMFDMILQPGLDYVLSDKETFDDKSKFNQLQKDRRDKIVDNFMNIRDKVRLEELRFYSI